MTKLEKLMHKCWGQAKESPDYDKDVWLALQKEVERTEPTVLQAGSRWTIDITAKDRMLSSLDEVRRKVETGEVIGLILCAVRKDDTFLSWRVGDPPGPHGLLVLEDIVEKGKILFLEENNRPSDGTPMVGVAEDDE